MQLHGAVIGHHGQLDFHQIEANVAGRQRGGVGRDRIAVEISADAGDHGGRILGGRGPPGNPIGTHFAEACGHNLDALAGVRGIAGADGHAAIGVEERGEAVTVHQDGRGNGLHAQVAVHGGSGGGVQGQGYGGAHGFKRHLDLRVGSSGVPDRVIEAGGGGFIDALAYHAEQRTGRGGTSRIVGRVQKPQDASAVRCGRGKDSVAFERGVQLNPARVEPHVQGAGHGERRRNFIPTLGVGGGGEAGVGVINSGVGSHVDRARGAVGGDGVRGGLGKIGADVVPHCAFGNTAQHVRAVTAQRCQRHSG